MSNSNDFAVAKSYKNVLGSTLSVCVTGTYNLYNGKRFAGVLNCARAEVDGRERSIYIVGENKPLSNAVVQIIAVAHDTKREQDILIASPEGIIFYQPKLESMFSKKLPLSRYRFICLYEKSCGAVLYTKTDGIRKFILITNISGHIGFPKGHIEHGENEKQTALREVYEETGVKANLIDGFRHSYNYFINGFIRKKAIYFLAEFATSDIKMNIREISEYHLLTYDEALGLLNFRHDKEILEKANKFVDMLEGK